MFVLGELRYRGTLFLVNSCYFLNKEYLDVLNDNFYVFWKMIGGLFYCRGNGVGK